MSILEPILITNEALNRSVEIGDGDYILTNVDWGVALGSHKTSKFVAQIGVVVTGSSIDTRDVMIEGWCNVPSGSPEAMKRLKRNLEQMINPLHPLILRSDGYRITMRPATTILYSTKWNEHNEYLTKFVIRGICDDPLFVTDSETLISMASFSSEFRLPVAIGTGAAGFAPKVIVSRRLESVTAEFENEGDVPCGMVVSFISNGDVENPYLQNMLTQEYIRIEKVMPKGQVVTVNTNEKQMGVQVVDNGQTSEGFMHLDLSSTFIQLAVGTNIFRYGADRNDSQLSVTMAFSPRFLEVY